MKKGISLVFLPLFFIFIIGCANNKMLASSEKKINYQNKTYQEIIKQYDLIIPGETTVEELKNLGIKPKKILNSADIRNKYLPNSSITKNDLEEGVRRAIKAKDSCYGWEIEYEGQKADFIISNRKDFLKNISNFKKIRNNSSWKIKFTLLIFENRNKRDEDTVVIYKERISGSPPTDDVTVEKNPLGPFQFITDVGGSANEVMKNAIY